MIKWYGVFIEISYGESLSLAKNGRVYSGIGAMLNSEELANKFAKRYTPSIKAHYGDEADIYVMERMENSTPVYGPKRLAKIEENSKYVRNLLETKEAPKIKNKIEINEGWIIEVNGYQWTVNYRIKTCYALAVSDKKFEFATKKGLAKIYFNKSIAEKKAEILKSRDDIENVSLECISVEESLPAQG